ncbi:MAG TPA: hypothetical protein PLD37_07085 [Usitatibacteraceae bacterium]|nr:hypothetical protein [Usitatibacteraceae bacterium]
MNRLTAIGLASLVAYGVLIAAKWGGAAITGEHGGEASGKAPAAALQAAPASSVQALPKAQLASFTRPTAAAKPMSGVAQEFRNTRDLRAFAEALLARRDSLSQEDRYFLARALETCQFALSMHDDLAASSDKARRQFIATLPASDPNAAKRIAAYDAADDSARCVRFQGMSLSSKDIDELYRQAAQAGEAKAQARLLVAELNKGFTTPKDGETRAVAMDDFQRIIRLLETRDADAMVTVAQFLAQNRLIGELRIGPSGEVPEPASLVGAFSLVACDFQPTCPSFDREALQACAYAGYCNSNSYEELYANFLASPWTYSMAMRYRGVIHTAIDTRNWGLLGLQKLVGAQARPR